MLEKSNRNNKMISTSMLAKQLHTTNDVILDVARRSGIEKEIKNGVATYWNEKEVSVIIKNIDYNNSRAKAPLTETKGKIKTTLMLKEEAQNSLNNLTDLPIQDQIKASLVLQQNIIEQLNDGVKLRDEKIERLEVKLGINEEYYSVKRVSMINKKSQKDYNWRALKNKSFELGLEIKDEQDSNYGTVKSYHIRVWKAVYPDEQY